MNPFESQIENKTNYIKRENQFSDLELRYSGKLSKDYSALELVEEAEKLYSELEEFNIKAPVEWNNGLTSVVAKVDKIKEQPIVDKDIIDSLYFNLSRYYLTKLQTEEPFLTDINSREQYVYGKNIKNNEIGLFLVDTDIYWSDKIESLLTVFYWFIRHGNNSISEKEDIRNNVIEFLEEYESKFTKISEGNKKRIEQIKIFLKTGYLGEEILPAIPTFE